MFEKGVRPGNRVAAAGMRGCNAVGRTDTQLQTEAMRCRPKAAALDPNLEAFVSLCLASAEGDLYAETHRRRLLTRVLEDSGGSQNQAARRLGIARDTLRRRLVELGLHLPRRSEAGEDNPD